jgi:glutamate decarboxylase
VATSLSSGIAELGPFRLLTRGDELPVFAFTVDGEASFNVFDVSRRLKERGWLVPAYTFPANRDDLAVLRVVCRNGFSHDLASMFLDDLRAALPELIRQPAPVTPPGAATAFHH